MKTLTKFNRRQLLGVSSAKTRKGEKLGYLTGILYLAPGDIAGFEVCANRSPGCTNACLYFAGRGQFNTVQLARIAKTQYFRKNKGEFMANIVKDIQALQRKAKREKMTPCIRLNGTSDLPFQNVLIEGQSILELFPNVQFYDYTKDHKRMVQYLRGAYPSNYHLTFSRSDINEIETLDVLKQGGNVSVVFTELPETWQGYKVIDADVHDLRFLDGRNVVCGLKFKGTKKAKFEAINSKFVVAV